MNIHLFIGEIKKRRVLWDHSNRHYHNKNALNDGWREIATIFNMEGKLSLCINRISNGISVYLAKQKWKNLRDTFRVELKKTRKYSLEHGDEFAKSLWAYYDDMYFIKDTLRTRRGAPERDAPLPTTETVIEGLGDVIKTERESLTSSPCPLIDDNETKDTPNIVIENVASLSHESDVDTTNDKRGIKRKKWTSEEQNDSIEDQDDDMLFFRSLLPFVRKLDQDKKLLFRMNVQEMLYNQLYN